MKPPFGIIPTRIGYERYSPTINPEKLRKHVIRVNAGLSKTPTADAIKRREFPVVRLVQGDFVRDMTPGKRVTAGEFWIVIMAGCGIVGAVILAFVMLGGGQ